MIVCLVCFSAGYQGYYVRLYVIFCLMRTLRNSINNPNALRIDYLLHVGDTSNFPGRILPLLLTPQHWHISGFFSLVEYGMFLPCFSERYATVL